MDFKRLTRLETFAAELFGLDCQVIDTISSSFTGESYIIHIQLTDRRPPCPFCGCQKSRINNYVQKRITHSKLVNERCVISYRQRRYRCPVCQKTWSENNPFVFNKMRISKETVISILEDLRSPSETFTTIADRYKVSPTTVQNIFDNYVNFPPATKLARVIQIDETYSFKSDNSKYVCMILDFDRQEPIDLLPTRHKKDLEAYFRRFPKAERDKVEYIAADMYAVYRDVCRSFFPKAVYAVDRFHLLQDYYRQMHKVRTRCMKGYDKKSDEYYLLKMKSDLLNIGPGQRKKDKSGKFYQILDPRIERSYNSHFKKPMNAFDLHQMLLDINDDLYQAYRFRNRLSSFFRTNTLETAPEVLAAIIKDLNKSGVPELVQFAATAQTWFVQIVNSFSIINTELTVLEDGTTREKYTYLTSSLIENRNKIVKEIKHNANGYTNWVRFRNRVLYVLKKDMHLRNPKPKKKKKCKGFK